MKTILDKALRFLASLGLSCVLLILLGLLTWLGTLEQVHMGLFEVQKKYFESFFLVHQAGPVPIPLPGANLVLCVLGANLIAGGVVRLRREWSRLGILISHVGIALLLLSGVVKLYFSEDGHVTLFEGESASHFQSYYRWELAISQDRGDGTLVEHRVPQEDFLDARGPRPVRLTSPELPFELEVSHVMPNCSVQPKTPDAAVATPVVDGLYLRPESLYAQAEANTAGASVRIVAAGGPQEGLVWGRERAPWTFEVGGERFAVGLRKERYPMPFTLRLEEFTKEDHPRMAMPRTFESEVTVTEAGASRPVTISMNEPLRDRGLVLYQASWGPSNARPGDPLFSTLSVVRNPADSYPLYACIVTSIGLLLHFARTLTRYVRSEARR